MTLKAFSVSVKEAQFSHPEVVVILKFECSLCNILLARSQETWCFLKTHSFKG